MAPWGCRAQGSQCSCISASVMLGREAVPGACVCWFASRCIRPHPQLPCPIFTYLQRRGRGWRGGGRGGARDHGVQAHQHARRACGAAPTAGRGRGRCGGGATGVWGRRPAAAARAAPQQGVWSFLLRMGSLLEARNMQLVEMVAAQQWVWVLSLKTETFLSTESTHAPCGVWGGVCWSLLLSG